MTDIHLQKAHLFNLCSNHTYDMLVSFWFQFFLYWQLIFSLASCSAMDKIVFVIYNLVLGPQSPIMSTFILIHVVISWIQIVLQSDRPTNLIIETPSRSKIIKHSSWSQIHIYNIVWKKHLLHRLNCFLCQFWLHQIFKSWWTDWGWGWSRVEMRLSRILVEIELRLGWVGDEISWHWIKEEIGLS